MVIWARLIQFFLNFFGPFKWDSLVLFSIFFGFFMRFCSFWNDFLLIFNDFWPFWPSGIDFDPPKPILNLWTDFGPVLDRFWTGFGPPFWPPESSFFGPPDLGPILGRFWAPFYVPESHTGLQGNRPPFLTPRIDPFWPLKSILTFWTVFRPLFWPPESTSFLTSRIDFFCLKMVLFRPKKAAFECFFAGKMVFIFANKRRIFA